MTDVRESESDVRPEVVSEHHNWTEVKAFLDSYRTREVGSSDFPVVLHTTAGRVALTAVEADRIGQALMAAAKRHWNSR